MTVLITGGLGFIGQQLAQELLRKGVAVVLVDNLSPQVHGPLPQLQQRWLSQPGVRMVRTDIRCTEEMDRALDGVDRIVHLAAETGTGQSMYLMSRYCDVNVLGTAHLMERLLARRGQVTKVVLASSRAVYGEGSYICPNCSPDLIRYPAARSRADLEASQWQPRCPACSAELKAIATDETAPPRASSIYAATKLAQEDVVRIGCEAAGAKGTILRFQNVYGEGQSLNNPYTGILSIFSNRIRIGRVLPLYEDGVESRDFVHVSDVVKAIVLALEANLPNGMVLNVGSGVATSVTEIARELAKAFGARFDSTVTGQYRLGDIRHCYADLSKIRAMLGFTPRMSLSEGMARFVEWVKTQPVGEDQQERANEELRRHQLSA